MSQSEILPGPLSAEAPQERADQVRQMFDRLCDRYELNNFLLSFGMDAYWRWRAKRVLNLAPDARVIDLCCGTGAVTRSLAKAVPQGEVLGVDFSEGMLGPAGRKGAPEGGGRVTYLCSDVLNIPVEGRQYDAATICYGPRNIVDLPALWKEMTRVLKPGGQVLSLELTRPKGVLGFLHDIYLNTVVPTIGGLVSGDREAYQYLNKTIEGFLSPEDLAQSMHDAGLERVKFIPLSGGIVTIHHARTPL